MRFYYIFEIIFMKFKIHKRAFTLTEMVMVIAIIWVLMMWMTVYISWSSERTQMIETQWCATTIWWVMDNYLYYTLTSRNISWNISPKYYYIQLTWWKSSVSENCSKGNTWIFCNQIILGYSTWDLGSDQNPSVYQTIKPSKVCRQNQPKIWFYWDETTTSWNIKYLKMNKWFSPTSISDKNVFYLQWNGIYSTYRPLLWDIIIVMCSEEECDSRKEIAKRKIDSRSQSITLVKCKYYEDDKIQCKTREDCKIYNSDDPTVCDKYYN